MAMVMEKIKSEQEDQEAAQPLQYTMISYPADYTLQGLYEKWKGEELIIAKFQRGWVWTPAQASKLIDSFLLGLPVPGIFLMKEPSQKHLVIDGQQRLRTICSFFDGKLPDGRPFYLKGEGLSAHWAGKRYTDLTEPMQRRLRDGVLRAIIVEQIHPDDKTSMYHIFERLNTGGTSLTPQEVRNSVYHGPFNDLMVQLNLDPVWREIMGTPKPDLHMRDVELMLRFFALVKGHDRYTKPMKDFMSSFMRDHQWLMRAEEFTNLLNDTVKRVVSALGARPFRPKGGLNAAVFDSVMVAFTTSESTRVDIKVRYQRLLANEGFIAAITAGTTDVDTVKSRIKLARAYLFG